MNHCLFGVPDRWQKNEYLLYWTTNPMDDPANIAIAVDEKIVNTPWFRDQRVYFLGWQKIWLRKAVFKKDYKKIVNKNSAVPGKESGWFKIRTGPHLITCRQSQKLQRETLKHFIRLFQQQIS